MTRDDLTSSYAIIPHNIWTFRSAGVLAVVKGRHKAESELKKFEDSREYSDRLDGWRYFVKKSPVSRGPHRGDPTAPSGIGKARIESAAKCNDSDRPFAEPSEMNPVYSLAETDDDNLQSTYGLWTTFSSLFAYVIEE